MGLKSYFKSKKYADELKDTLFINYSFGYLGYIVKCKNCKHLIADDSQGTTCELLKAHLGENGFCSFGEFSDKASKDLDELSEALNTGDIKKLENFIIDK